MTDLAMTWAAMKTSAWWYTYPSDKYEFVNWDDDIPNIWKIKHVPNHQIAFVKKNIHY